MMKTHYIIDGNEEALFIQKQLRQKGIHMEIKDIIACLEAQVQYMVEKGFVKGEPLR